MSDDETNGPYKNEGKTVYATDPKTEDIEDAIDEDKPKYQQKAWLYAQYHQFKKSQKKIAKECGVTRSTISNWLDRLNIEKRDLSTATSIAMGSDERLRNEDWLRKKYVDEKKSFNNIANQLDCSTWSVHHALKKYDISTRSKGNTQMINLKNDETKPYTDENWLRHHYRTLGKSTPEIADEVGVTPYTILDWLEKFGIQTRSLKSAQLLHNKRKKGVKLTNERNLVTEEGIDASWKDLSDIKNGKIVKYRNKTWLENKLKNGNSAQDIADVCNTSHTTIYRWVYKYDLDEYLQR